MSEATQKLSVGELKFRAMVSDLQAMEVPRMAIDCPSSSKARNLRRMFYIWGAKMPAYESKFLSTLQYKLRGRTILVERRLDFQPVEVSPDVSSSKGLVSRGT